jgi:hypothetical protein
LDGNEIKCKTHLAHCRSVAASITNPKSLVFNLKG